MEQPLFLAPVFQEKIWGGDKLNTVFGYDLPEGKIGECWAISAHKNGTCHVENGPYKGKKLDELWANNRELFGNAEGDVFPLLTKILDANDDLSVQVHPDDSYGLKHEGELGKTECWYVIDAEEGAEIIYGHHATSREELSQMIEEGRWDDLLRRIKVKKGDFFHVPSGTIHAIGAGIMILETQQSSDTTYRVYDYDRKGDDGQTRELHIKQSVDVTTVPHHDPKLAIKQTNLGNSSITEYVRTPFFNVYEWLISGVTTFKQQANYTLVSVLEGAGHLVLTDGKEEYSYDLAKGSHFILPNQIKSWRLEGDMQLIASEPGEQA
ncbi:mannose-6-phosphate isomerase, class I [Vagococcus intermedius]|uniref:Mannose-6-phosphate isomerase n=1 Tax=Vagococcus intermedius TaxID=2991418 RepID=A0AAF0CVR7_9ENTE|nr:mannose-6-phosphate isomerase, class I [Vagococcus intermedius]WEG73759.1 mannose-6-phosphate isomerase, class I [Vagococcus intermedius]WEG75844.1 mannose-6-phosphate isomerase, class I [Vagococcus intermedius]